MFDVSVETNKWKTKYIICMTGNLFIAIEVLEFETAKFSSGLEG